MKISIPVPSITRLLLLLVILLVAPANQSFSTAAAPPYEDPLAEIVAILVNDVPATDPVTVSQIEVQRAATGNVEPGTVGMKLFVNDQIKTGPGVEASVVFTRPDSDDRIEVQVQPNSKAKISSLFGYYGGFFLSGWGLFDTKTSYARLGKRGTEFQLEVNEEGDIDLRVLRGVVDVEKGEFSPDGPDVAATGSADRKQPNPVVRFRHATRRAMAVEAKQVGRLQSMLIKRSEALPEPRALSSDEAINILNKTDKLILASLPAAPPKNIITTSAIPKNPDADPVETAQTVQQAFKDARRKAILEPNATNFVALGDVYKDLGAGKRSLGEYKEAEAEKPALRDNVKFLASQAEAYRLSGNLIKAEQKGVEAVRKSRRADPSSAQLALNALGNVKYDKAVASIARGEWDAAKRFFRASQTAFEDASKGQSVDVNVRVIKYNLDNVKLAFGDDPATPSSLNGTYRGAVNFPAAGIKGSAVLVFTGKRFTLMTCEESLRGSIITSRETPEGQLFEFVFDGKSPVKRITLKADVIDDKITLSSLASDRNTFSFRTLLKQPALKCIRMSNVR